MELPKRLENAVTKLYNAFHKGELEAIDCEACAVGNMCDGNTEWYDVFHDGKIHNNNTFYNPTGYSTTELMKVEKIFMDTISNSPHNYFKSKDERKDANFQGLCEVVKYLCELDNVPNIMEIQSLFDYDENGAVNNLTLIQNECSVPN